VANIIEATYDGRALLPDEPLELEPNTRVRIIVETVLPENGDGPSFFRTARSLRVDGPPDWSRNLDKYLYGPLQSNLDEQSGEDGE
jgi:hypothetical protein